MKKNISINISGIIFHIEEDGYEALRKYLDSINQYFGSFEDSSEILADIESRIAEIFPSRLNEGKQVITAEDVQSLITTMGNVNDFKAAEEQEVVTGAGSKQGQRQPPGGESGSASSGSDAVSRKLFRDSKRKIMGGVCAGFGHYFNSDPVWPRLLFALLFFGTSGILLLVYIVLWIVLPVSEELEDEPNVKKMYRNPDAKVVGGVAGGVAAFFGADVVLIRFLFVIFTIFFGTGLVVYIILWIALPEAKTITEKMKMQGEPVTLSNIESSVKKGLNEKDQPEESMLAKIILFPFRVIAAVLNGIGSVLGPLLTVMVEVLRVGIGVIISLIGLGFILSLIFAFGILVGLFSTSALPAWWDTHVSTMSLPLETIRQSFPTWTAVFAFLAAFIPALFIMLIGNSIIAKKIVFRPLFGWTMFVLFFISIAFLSFSIPQLVYAFKEDGEYKVEKLFTVKGKTPVMKLREGGLDDYKVTALYLRGYEGTDLKLVERFGSQGITKMNARENAEQVDYRVEQTDSVISFDSNISFKKDAKFSFQRLDLDLYIPYEMPFVVEEDLWDLIENQWRNDYTHHDRSQTYKIKKNGKMECITCPAPEKDVSGLSANDQFGLKDFNEIEMTGAFNVVIQKGDEYAIQLEGSAEQKRLYTLGVHSETLEVGYRTRNKNFWKQDFTDDEMMDLSITMPSLRKLKVTGAGKIKIRGFDEHEAQISLVGAMTGDARINVNQLSVETTGPVVFELSGEGDFLEASITGPSQFKASNYPVNHAIIEARGLGQARVNVKGTLGIDKDFTSNVRYTGNPEVIKRD